MRRGARAPEIGSRRGDASPTPDAASPHACNPPRACVLFSMSTSTSTSPNFSLSRPSAPPRAPSPPRPRAPRRDFRVVAPRNRLASPPPPACVKRSVSRTSYRSNVEREARVKSDDGKSPQGTACTTRTGSYGKQSHRRRRRRPPPSLRRRRASAAATETTYASDAKRTPLVRHLDLEPARHLRGDARGGATHERDPTVGAPRGARRRRRRRRRRPPGWRRTPRPSTSVTGGVAGAGDVHRPGRRRARARAEEDAAREFLRDGGEGFAHSARRRADADADADADDRGPPRGTGTPPGPVPSRRRSRSLARPSPPASRRRRRPRPLARPPPLAADTAAACPGVRRSRSARRPRTTRAVHTSLLDAPRAVPRCNVGAHAYDAARSTNRSSAPRPAASSTWSRSGASVAWVRGRAAALATRIAVGAVSAVAAAAAAVATVDVPSSPSSAPVPPAAARHVRRPRRSVSPLSAARRPFPALERQSPARDDGVQRGGRVGRRGSAASSAAARI